MTEERRETHEVVIDSEEGVTETHTHKVIDREGVTERPETTTIVEKVTVIEEEEF
jgi:hypothetical protein